MMDEGARDDIRNWQLERYLLGELPADEAQAVRDALARDETLRHRLAALERSNTEILAHHPSRVMAAAIRARLAGEWPARRERRSWLGGFTRRPALATALGLAALVASFGVLAPVWRATRPPIAPTRVKGLAPHVLLYRQTAPSAVEALSPGSAVRNNDVVQIAYQAAGRRYGVIVSVDGQGIVTRHLPKTGAQAAALQAGPPVPLAEAYKLDDAPDFERFYLVTADEPFTVDAVIAAVRRRYDGLAESTPAGDRLDLPESFGQFSLVLRKESSR